MGVGEVGIGVSPAEILQRNSIAHTAGWCSKKFLEQFVGIGACYRVHGIEGQGEVAADEFADLIKVEQLLHQFHEVIHSVDHLHLHRADAVGARGIDRYGGSFDD